MKLKSFRIIDCFGFSDSGNINFETCSNKYDLFYIIGRNSSGKSSFLRALNSLEYGVTPNKEKGFNNHKGKKQDSRLESIFQLNKNDIKVKTHIDYVKNNLFKDKCGIPLDLIDSNETLSLFIDTVNSLYSELIKNLNSEIKIDKLENGDYIFIDSTDSYKTRLENINQLITQTFNTKQGEQFQFRNENQSYNLNFRSQDVENLLFLQFPRIYNFDKEYDLRSDIPDVIQLENISNLNNQPEAVKTFLEYLGVEKLKDYLTTSDNEKQAEYNLEFTTLIKTALKRIKHPLLDIFVSHNQTGLQITFKANKGSSYFSLLSDNTKLLFHLLIYLESFDISQDIILFDEPNNGFHATAQQDLLDNLKEISTKNKIIISTHSEYLIDTDLLPNVRRMTRDNGNNLSVKNDIYNSSGVKGEYLSLQPIAESLGLKYVNQLKVNSDVILLEGLSDLYYIQAFAKLSRKGDINNLLPARGDSSLLTIVPFVVSQGLNFKVVLDTSNKVVDKSKRVIKDILISDYSLSQVSIHLIPPLLSQTDDSGIEDVFSKKDFQDFVLNNEISKNEEKKYKNISNSAYVKSKKSLNKNSLAFKFFSNIDSIKLSDLEESTQGRITTLLDFVNKKDNYFKIN